MSSNTLIAPLGGVPSGSGTGTRLAVTWQHPATRGREAVGLLTCDDSGFQFRYLRRVDQVDGFQPFLGFDDLHRVYTSEQLFPLFAQRVMSPARPDFLRHLHALWLPESASAWEILGRSQGQREGDGIRVFVEPNVDADGHTEATFLVHGLRYVLRDHPEREQLMAQLAEGEQLRLVDEPDNPVDSRALLVSQSSGISLGWVPSVLLDYVHEVRTTGEPVVRVVRANGPDVPPGYRLLVQLTGRVAPGYRPFDGPAWQTAA